MIKFRFIAISFLLLVNILFANTQKVYFYAADKNINNYKSLKITFEEYLSQFGDFEFQAFSDKDNFEKYLHDKDIIVILSSWQYKKIFDHYKIKAKLVAQKKDSKSDSKVLVGLNNETLNGTIASSYSKEYTKKTLLNLKNTQLNIIKVPKEMDALMSVSFGMSQFAMVSKDNFEMFSKINSSLSKNMKIYKEFDPTYRMLVSFKVNSNPQINIFNNMRKHKGGRKILYLLGIDRFVLLNKSDHKKLGDLK